MEIHQRRLAPTAGLALEDELEQAHHSYHPTAHRRHSKPTLWGPTPAGRTLAVYVALLLAYGALCWLVSTYSARVPEPVPAGAPPQLFSEGRARLHLEQLIKQIGWRQAGTRNNDVLTVNWLLEKLNAVQEEAMAIDGGSRLLDIELQSGSSAYTLYFVDAYITNTYSNITNILVRVPARNKPADAYSPLLLINSHFDSGVGATGASDDGVATVACLEMVRNLVYEPPLDYDVLFLFNGAEEPLLPASHAFVTQHPLAKRVKAVVNLEAAGAGGPALAFQIGSADLAYAYASVVPYPHTMVTAAEIFQSGVIPADTDYRIFRDFGEIPGIDMAFYQNGYVYHTPLDDLDMVTPGSIQHMGGNTLALARHLTDAQASDHLLAKPRDSSSSRAFYFSLFGWCVAYSALWGFVANVVAACLCVGFSWRAIGEGERSKLRQMYVGMLQATLAGVLSSVLTALVLGNVLGHPLSYFSAPWLGTTLHSAAFVLGFLLVMRRVFTAINNVHQYGKPVEDHTILNETTEELAVHAGMLFFTTISLLLTAAGVFTSWFFAAQSLFLVAARAWQLLYRSVILPRLIGHAPADDEIIGSGPRAQRVPGLPHWTETPARALFYALTVAPTALLTLPAYQVGLGMILPLLGRAGVAVPPDLVIGAITSLMALCLLVPAVPALIQAGNLRYAIRIVGVVLLVLVVVALLSFPYGAATPKRLIAQHTYHRPVQVLHKTTTTGLTPTPDDQAAKIADMIAKFNAEDRSGKPDVDDSFVLLGSFDYIPADVVFSGLDGPPPSFKLAEDVLYNFLPVYPFQPFMSAVQLPAAVPAGSGLFSSGRMEHPTIRVVKDEFHASTDIRTLVLSFDYTGFEISTLRLDATDSPLLEWAFSSTDDWRAGKVPHFSTPPAAARGDYFIRHIGGYGTREWVVLLRMRGLDPVRLDIAGTHLRMTPELEALSRMLPDWATSYFFYSEVTTWIVE